MDGHRMAGYVVSLAGRRWVELGSNFWVYAMADTSAPLIIVQIIVAQCETPAPYSFHSYATCLRIQYITWSDVMRSLPYHVSMLDVYFSWQESELSAKICGKFLLQSAKTLAHSLLYRESPIATRSWRLRERRSHTSFNGFRTSERCSASDLNQIGNLRRKWQ